MDGAPRVFSVLTEREISSCKSVRSLCIQLQEELNAHQQRLAVEDRSEAALGLIQLYNNTLQHLDAAADRLFEIGLY